MSIRFLRAPVWAATLIAGTLIYAGCATEEGGTEDGDGNESSAMNYNGPGSKWDFELEDGEFSITRRANVESAVTLTVNGTYQRNDAGFLILTVSDAEGEDAPDEGAQAWAIEVPGYALILKPMNENSDQVIPMVSAGNCPSVDVDANWVIVKKAGAAAADDADRDFFGTFNFIVNTGTPSLPSRRALANNFQDGGAAALSGGECANGIMSVEDAVMYLTSNGGAIVHTGINTPNDSSFIFALGQKAIDDVDNLDGNYAGVLFDDSSSDGQKIEPVALACTAGLCTGTLVTDVVTGATSAESVTVTLDGGEDLLGDGLVTGTITSGANTGNLACMADVDVLDTGRRMVSCVGQSPGDNTNMFNVLFTSIEDS